MNVGLALLHRSAKGHGKPGTGRLNSEVTLAARSRVLLFAWVSLLLAGCHGPVSSRPIGKEEKINIPFGLPSLTIPPENLPTADSIALGRRLFYDKNLSVDGTVACASCHMPSLDFTDGRNVSKGVGGAIGDRNAPTLLNAAYLPFQFWDGRAISLEDQAAGPITNTAEMNLQQTASVSKLADDPIYPNIFEKAFGSKQITMQRVENALASFERTLLSGNSAFDRYQYGSDKNAMSASQIRGLAVFLDPNRGNCAACHTIGPTSALFTDGRFHNTGEGATDSGEFGDVGRYHETKIATDQGAFKTPTLRNIANTAPYMHDGSLKTLQNVVDFYAGGGNSNPYLDSAMKTIHLSGQDRTDLVEFLKALTGAPPPNSGLPESNVQ